MNSQLAFPIKRVEGTRLWQTLPLGIGGAFILWVITVMAISDADGLTPAIRLVLFVITAVLFLGVGVGICIRVSRNTHFTLERGAVHVAEGTVLGRSHTDIPLRDYRGLGLTEGPRVGINTSRPAREWRAKLVHPDEPRYSVTLYRSIPKDRCEERAREYAVFLGVQYLGDTGIREDS